MAEGQPPTTPTTAARVLIGWFAGALAFESVHAFATAAYWASAEYSVAAVVVAIFDYKLPSLLSPRAAQTLNAVAEDARWWVGAVIAVFVLLGLLPVAELSYSHFSYPPADVRGVATTPTQPDPRDARIADLTAQIADLTAQLKAARTAAKQPILAPALTLASPPPPKRPLSPEDRRQLDIEIGILQSVRDDRLKQFAQIYDQETAWKTNWEHKVKDGRENFLGMLNQFKMSMGDASQGLETLHIEYSGYNDVSDILVQPHTNEILKALDDLATFVGELPNPLPPDYDTKIRPYMSTLTVEFEAMKGWIDKTQVAVDKRIKDLSALRQQ
jgi:hypothetical protein